MSWNRNRQFGFTLIEVLITIAIVAILSAIAIPAYTDYIRRGNIIDATSALADGRVKAEQWFQDSPGHVYTGAICPGDTKFFLITCDFQAATFLITATGRAGTSMDGFTYTIDEANTRSTTAVPSGWSGAGNSCWVLRKGGSC